MLKKYIIALLLLLAPKLISIFHMFGISLLALPSFGNFANIIPYVVLPAYISSQKNKEDRRQLNIMMAIALVAIIISNIVIVSVSNVTGWAAVFVVVVPYIIPIPILYPIAYNIHKRYFRK